MAVEEVSMRVGWWGGSSSRVHNDTYQYRFVHMIDKYYHIITCRVIFERRLPYFKSLPAYATNTLRWQIATTLCIPYRMFFRYADPNPPAVGGLHPTYDIKDYTAIGNGALGNQKPPDSTSSIILHIIRWAQALQYA